MSENRAVVLTSCAAGWTYLSYFARQAGGEARIVERPQRLQATLFFRGKRKAVDQLPERTLIDCASTRVLFEAFVAARYSRSAQYSLDGLTEYLPRVLQIGRQGRGVRLDLTEAAAERTPRDEGMAECDAQIAQHGRVGEIALPAGDGQLVGEVSQQGVGDAEVALGILEVDGVDLVRHGRGTHLGRGRALLEVTERDVTPEVAAQIEEHDVDRG